MTIQKLIAAVTFLAASAASALAGSHRVNIEPVRDFVQNKLVVAGKLNPGTKVNAQQLPKGITQAAYRKALETKNGFNAFGDRQMDISVTKMGKQKVLVIAGPSRITQDSKPLVLQRFVVRSGKRGLVIARGNVDGNGKISWTRSHNRNSSLTPAERNDAQ